MHCIFTMEPAMGAAYAFSCPKPHLAVERMIGVYTGQRDYVFDGVEVMPVERFLTELHSGAIF